MSEKTENKKWIWTDRKYNVLLFLASVLSPWLILLYFYTHNPIPPSGMAYVTIACVMTGYVVAWLISAKLFRSTITATFLCFFATIHLWVGYRVFEFLPQENRAFLTVVKIIVFLAIIVLFVVMGNKLQPKLQTVAPVILIVTGAVLIMNVLPVLDFAWRKTRAGNFIVETQQLYSDKGYAVDEAFPSPNVYWIHCDGMLGFSSVEKYFGDDQAEFKQSLADRNFAINETASFEALHSTVFAVNALMNPAWYDHGLQEEISTGTSILYQGSKERSAFINARWQALRLGIEKNELLEAFAEKNYTLATAQGDSSQVFSTMAQRVYLADYVYEEMNISSPYDTDFERAFSSILVELQKMLQKVFMPEGVKIPMIDVQNNRYAVTIRQLADILNKTSKNGNISLVFYSSSHFPFEYDENGNFVQGDQYAAENYLGTHQYAAKTVIEAVDMILEKDPDAIIVLQADHGLHGLYADDIHEQLGADAVPEEIWNQVLSAVRVPEQYQNEDFHYAMEDPRNISRWLINSFVGEQYEYLT